MIAELHNKISLTGSNLSDKLEDQLTGDFFGTLRYIPFEDGLQRILGSRCVFPADVGERISSLACDNEQIKYHFWKRLRDYDNSIVEPDLIIELNNTVVCIEVKYNSGLSSNDKDTEFDDVSAKLEFFDEVAESNNQLAREARAIAKAYKDKQLFLLFVARDEICDCVYKQSVDRIQQDVAFARLSWSDICEIVSQLRETSSGTEKTIFNDIVMLLERKGFDRFKCFSLSKESAIVNAKEVFEFDYKSNPFEFENKMEIKGDLHYEFRR